MVGQTSFERGLEQGRAITAQTSFEKGIEKGTEKTRRDLLRLVLEERFGIAAGSLSNRIEKLSGREFDNFFRESVRTQSLSDLEKLV